MEDGCESKVSQSVALHKEKRNKWKVGYEHQTMLLEVIGLERDCLSFHYLRQHFNLTNSQFQPESIEATPPLPTKFVWKEERNKAHIRLCFSTLKTKYISQPQHHVCPLIFENVCNTMSSDCL